MLTTFCAASVSSIACSYSRKRQQRRATSRWPIRKHTRHGPPYDPPLYTAGSLAVALQNLGKEAEAEPVLRNTLAIQQRVLGKGHFRTLDTAYILAALLVNTGKCDEAVELSRGALAQATRTLGPDHPLSLRVAYSLAAALGEQGQATEAVALLTVTLAAQQRVLGPGRPETLTTARLLQRYQLRC